MVLLDHGLYKEMSPKIRIAYCQLWKALVLRRRADVEKYGQELGAGQFTNLLALVLTFRTLDKFVAIQFIYCQGLNLTLTSRAAPTLG
jgi:aarF domain-containing kinase